MIQNMDQRLPSHYEVTIFRFIQEALNNVIATRTPSRCACSSM